MEVQSMFIPQLSQLDDGEKKYLITRGGQQLQWYPFTAQSSSNSNMVFKLDPPSPSTVLDRNLIIEVPFSMEISGVPVNEAGMLVQNAFALRAYPFSSVVETLTAIINGQSITTQLSNVVHMLSRYNNTSESRTTFGSVFPNALDAYQSYSSGAGNGVLNGYEGATPGSYLPRGAYNLKVTQNTQGNGSNTQISKVEGVIVEYINLSPFYQRLQQGTGGLSNIQNLTLNFTMSNLARMFSINPASVVSIDTVDVTLTEPTIYCGFITPPVDFSIPRSLNFAYNDYSYYVTSHGAAVPKVTAGGVIASVDLVSNVIQWSQLPEKIYVCVRKRRSDLTTGATKSVTSTDTYFSIENININFANQDGIQSATKPSALYLQSIRNGCNMSFVEWTGKAQSYHKTGVSTHLGTAGSVLALELGKDIPLQGLDAVAMSGSWNFQIRVKASNVSAAEDITPELAIIAVFDGIMTIEHPGQAFVTLGIVTPEQVLQAPPSGDDYDDVMRLYGGTFGSNIKRFFKKHGDTFRNVGKAVGSVVAPELTQQLTGIVDQGQNIVRAAQQDARAMTASGLDGGMRAGMRAGLRAGNLQGGAMIPKSTLRSRAR